MGTQPVVDRVAASVASWIARHGLPPAGRPLVVGCSGGADSTSLVLALHEWRGAPLHVVYVDHGLRPGLDAEAAMVASLASSVGATFEISRVEVCRTGNLLAAARTARYAALLEIAVRHEAACIAVGHTATDQAETVIFRAQRGDVSHGLAGMPPRRELALRTSTGTLARVTLIRPLLEVTRDETARFVRERGLRAVCDPSNEKEQYTRVRIRRALEAEVRKTANISAGPGSPSGARLDEELAAMASLMAAEVALLDEAALALGSLDQLEAGAVVAAGFGVALRLLRRAGVAWAGRAHAHAFLALASSTAGSRSIDLGQGIRAERTYKYIRFLQASPAPVTGSLLQANTDTRDSVVVTGPGRYFFEGRTIELGPPQMEVTGGRHAMNPALLPPAFLLRHTRPGDRLRFAGGRRKLQDVLVDRKVPRANRDALLVLATAGGNQVEGGEVLWLEGVGSATYLKPTAAGAAALHVTVWPALLADESCPL